MYYLNLSIVGNERPLLSGTNDCGCGCSTPSTTNIPGVAGENAFTVTTATFVVPALGNSVTVAVVSSDFAVVGQSIYIGTAGIFTGVSKPTATSLLVQYSNIASNTAAGNTIASGVGVAPGGKPGADGSDGGNAYTITAADFVVPAISGSVSVTVANSSWMVVNQNVYVAGAGVFQVTTKADSTHFTGTYLDYTGNTHATDTISSGAGVSPGGTQASFPTPLAVASGGTGGATLTAALASLGLGQAATVAYGAGTAYQLTATPALIAMGTTSPTITIPSTGVYRLTARARIDYNGATFAAVQTIALKLRRTAAVAGDITNATLGHKTDIITTKTYTAMNSTFADVYFSATAADVIQLWGSISVVPSAGSIDVAECYLEAQPLHIP